MTAATLPKITYTSTNVDLDQFHALFDEALARVRGASGKEYPMYIDGNAVRTSAEPIIDRSPIDSSRVLGTFHTARPEQIDLAVRAARGAAKAWAALGAEKRIALLRRAAELIRERKFELAAIMSIEVGKSRLEAMGDAEESADLIDYYCQQMQDAHGFEREMAKMTAIERNVDVLRPFGVFACIAPFNFPLALSTGMSSAALVAGNTIVYKPAEEAPWTGLKLYEIYRDAGVPAGVFNLIQGHGHLIGDAIWRHPGVDGVVFTGSKEVGMRIFAEFSTRWARPCLLELGGKNAAIVMDTADIDAAAEGVMRSAFGLQNQKCSATSRVYVHKAVAKEFTDAVLAKTQKLVIGDPSERDVFFGPVINEQAVSRYERAVAQAKAEGMLLAGGGRVTSEPLAKGYYVSPAIALLPLDSSIFRTELFAPLLAIGEVGSFEEAIAESNRTEYGLTAGIYSGSDEEVARFFDEIEAGVCYANKRSGATTGAWPGAQAFTGWKGSGSSGKGGCGPYYVMQFMREQSRTTIHAPVQE
ncbi:MAG: aldehyde dehydrogenase family protein [Gemmatimonadaceae bacterium]|nr:aldehyde dehydrogenase family protein [Gemmatimonadaceae bacterium]